EAAIRGGQTSASVLLNAALRGASVYSHPRVHAKVLKVGSAAIVSSANFSISSQGLREAGVLLNDSQAIAGLSEYLEELRNEASPLDVEKLRSLASLPVEHEAPRGEVKPSLLEALAGRL